MIHTCSKVHEKIQLTLGTRFCSLDNFVYRRGKSSVDVDYPRPARDLFGRWEGGIWQTLPDQIDTALTWPNQQIFFFKVMNGILN